MSNLLKAALDYHSRGWCVMPLNAKTRTPIDKWKRFQNERPNREQIIEWWTKWPDASIGIITGKVSGLAVVDLDSEEAIRAFRKQFGKFNTPVSETRRGFHLLFAYVNGARNRVRLNGIELDVRGEGGYIVAPPSIHPLSGKRYRWRRPPDTPLAPFPLELLTKGSPVPENAASTHKPRGELHETIPDGQRNDTLFYDLACSLRGRGASLEELQQALTDANARCKPPLPESELRTIAESAAKYPPNKPKRHHTQLSFAEQEVLRERRVNRTAILVLLCLKRRGNFKTLENSYPSDERVAEDLGLKSITVRKARYVLRAAGLLEWDLNASRYRTNIYRFPLHHASDPVTSRNRSPVRRTGQEPVEPVTGKGQQAVTDKTRGPVTWRNNDSKALKQETSI